MTANQINTVLTKAADNEAWRNVSNEAIRLAELSKATFSSVYEKRASLIAEPGYGYFWYNPDDKVLFFNLGNTKDLTKVADWHSKLQGTPNTDALEYGWTETPDNQYGPWVPFNFYNPKALFKQAEEPGEFDHMKVDQPGEGSQPFKLIGQVAGYSPGITSSLLGGVGPLSKTIGGGLLGAGLGYGSGWLAENLFPDTFKKKRLRKTLALLGGIGGAVPGVWEATARYRNGDPMFGEGKTACAGLNEALPDVELHEMFYKALKKQADLPAINVDEFNRVIWSPYDRWTDNSLRAGASALNDAAGYLNQSAWITPSDIARVVIGTGTGSLAGSIVGRTLGALAGLSPDAQRSLQESGRWAGLMKAVMPMAFSGSR